MSVTVVVALPIIVTVVVVAVVAIRNQVKSQVEKGKKEGKTWMQLSTNSLITMYIHHKQMSLSISIVIATLYVPNDYIFFCMKLTTSIMR